MASAKEPNELVDLLVDLRGEDWHVDGKDEERVSTADIRAHLGMKPADAIRAHNTGRRIFDAMTVLGWTKAAATLRCHKGDQPTTGYTRPLPIGARDTPHRRSQHSKPRLMSESPTKAMQRGVARLVGIRVA